MARPSRWTAARRWRWAATSISSRLDRRGLDPGARCDQGSERKGPCRAGITLSSLRKQDDAAVLFLARDDAKLRATKNKHTGETCPPQENRQTLPRWCARGRKAVAMPLRLNSRAAAPV